MVLTLEVIFHLNIFPTGGHASFYIVNGIKFGNLDYLVVRFTNHKTPRTSSIETVLPGDSLYNHTTVQWKENRCTWPLVTYHSNIFPTGGHASRGVDNRTL